MIKFEKSYLEKVDVPTEIYKRACYYKSTELFEFIKSIFDETYARIKFDDFLLKLDKRRIAKTKEYSVCEVLFVKFAK